MSKLNIDLGSEMSEPATPSQPSNDTKKYYPSFHYSGDKPLKLPREGEMVVRFKKISSEHRVDSDNKDQYACTVEIREIVSASDDDGAEAPAGNRMKDSEDALDRIRSEKMKSHEGDGY